MPSRHNDKQTPDIVSQCSKCGRLFEILQLDRPNTYTEFFYCEECLKYEQ